MKRKYPKHYSPKPNEWVPHSVKMQWQCCDCGLVHNVTFRLKILEVKMSRNARETRKVRKVMGRGIMWGKQTHPVG